MKTTLLLITLLTFGLSACDKKTTAELSTPEEKASYAIGYAQSKKLQEIDVQMSAGAYFQGISDGQSGKDGLLTEDQRKAAIQNFQKLIQEKAMEQQKQKSEGAAAAGVAFLKENGAKEGIITEENGIQYKVITSGTGKSPKATNQVKVHYRGTLIDGTEFDSSYARKEPIVFPLNRVIPGWTYILQKMKTGDKWTVYIPSELAYGPQNAGPIPANSTLIFDIELLEVI